ncbi:MAG: peptide-methionine (R)-S-oxide reductase MsrB [Euryhalocaulis sp.]|uniref:peptide-methionine (R)-S-oxide reductase MsrB n=1 Tax=Euryhalocaulis sp. TaxID=2744307 RepID=UPI0017A7E67A|nr:peptide-methionine (R)-S-oxide reductase MsrB [Euryhalocaulis sp.]MBA4800975.1 peptide-methionine (R)-S-oxide reductase MsrB [Euryhalocaulis sp.]
MKTTRRNLVIGGLVSGLAIPGCAKAASDPEDAFKDSEWRDLSADAWKERLDPLAYKVLRKEGTERAFTSPLNDEKREGVFVCAGCELELFKSEWKFDSGTGWPSFYTFIEGALGEKTDLRLWTPRREYHCARCLGHQGHVFDDWPDVPTGLRYCNNGVALKFIPA